MTRGKTVFFFVLFLIGSLFELRVQALEAKNIQSFYRPDDRINILYDADSGSGTLTICVLGTQKDISIRVAKDSSNYLHHISPGEPTVIPLTMGSGDYLLEARLYITPTSIEHIWRTSFTLELKNELAPYLSASRIVNWSPEMALAAKAKSLAVAGDAKATALAICGFIAAKYSYANANPPSTYLPDLDDVFAKDTGICYDFAALYAGMCRSVGIACRLVMGYSDYVVQGKYHAWCEVYVDGQWLMVDPTYSMENSAIFLEASKTVQLKYH